MKSPPTRTIDNAGSVCYRTPHMQPFLLLAMRAETKTTLRQKEPVVVLIV